MNHDVISERINYRHLVYPIRLHDEILPLLKENALGKRLKLVLSHLAAHGRTNIVKSCRDDANRGWLRTPVEGNHQYLWWSRQGNAPVAGMNISPNTIVVRAVRGHDNHTPLAAGNLDDDFVFWEAMDLHVEYQPWTEVQRNFIRDPHHVRLLMGRPGSGKTTALWQAITARDNQNVIYLTWSPRLAAVAREHFASFAGQGVQFIVHDLRSFWSQILARDLIRMDECTSKRIFLNRLEYLLDSELGLWATDDVKKNLYAEARAGVYGMGDPLIGARPLGRLDSLQYDQERHPDLGIAATQVVSIMERLENGGLTPSEWIPDLEWACEAARSIANDSTVALSQLQLPAIVHRIVIDEVQDLTILEYKALMFFYAAVTRNQKEPPYLLVAGDEGQTVVPTLFKWGAIKDIITSTMTALIETHAAYVSECQLLESLRCPTNVCHLLDKAALLYRDLPRALRPGDQRTNAADTPIQNAQIIHSVHYDNAEASDLLQNLADREGFAVINLGEPNVHFPAVVLQTSEAKGLEYQSVCLVNPGLHLSKIQQLITNNNELSKQMAREAIDHFRVAMSRATGDLIFFDICPNVNDLQQSRVFLGEELQTDAERLREFFDDMELTPEHRVAARVKLASQLEDSDMRRAWNIALESWKLLTGAATSTGFCDAEIHQEVTTVVLRLAGRIIVGEIDDKDTARRARKIANTIVDDTARPVLEALEQWVDSSPANEKPSAATTIKLLQSMTTATNIGWIKPAIENVTQQLRVSLRMAATEPEGAVSFCENVSKWLELTGQHEALPEQEKQLRDVAFATLIKADLLDDASTLMTQCFPEDDLKKAQWHEAKKNHREAADWFMKIEMSQEALRNWRLAGAWEEAHQLAKELDLVRLSWLTNLSDHMQRKPEKLDEWLTHAEKQRLHDLLDKNKTAL